MRPFFSIVIPTLNEKKSIPRLIRQIKKQTYSNFEIIIVDAQSDDGTFDVVNKFLKNTPRLNLVSAEVRNLCYQKNLGAKLAKGKYLVFQDADNQVAKNYLEKIHQEIAKKKKLFLTTYQLSDSNETIDETLAELSNIMMELLLLINRQMAPGYNFIIEQKFFHDVGEFDESAVFSEDHELSMRIFQKKHIKLHIIRQHLLRWSFRRLRQQGRIPIIAKYSVAMLHMFFLGKITDERFRYPMGGGHYDNFGKKKKAMFLSESFQQLQQRLRSFDIEHLDNELSKYLKIIFLGNKRGQVKKMIKDSFALLRKIIEE